MAGIIPVQSTFSGMPERPKDLIYALDEKPPPLQSLALGFQHVAVICPYLVVVALVAVMIFPEFYESLPAWTRQFTGSEITMAVICSVALNAIFLLGTWRYGQLRVEEGESPVTAKSFDDFFLQQASEWKIPPEDVKRVRSVVDEAIEQVSANAQGPVEIRVGSDSFDVKVALKYVGNLPSLPDARPKREMVEEQSFVNGLTGYLSGLHADQIERSEGEECEINLLFRL